MAEGFRAANICVFLFDDVLDTNDSTPATRDESLSVAREADVGIVPVSKTLAAAPDRGNFLCLDHIHMKEPYHRIMAKKWLKVILTMNAKSAQKSPKK
jgi:hypothetical protein